MMTIRTCTTNSMNAWTEWKTDGHVCAMIVRTHAVTRYFVAGSDEDDDSVSMPKCLQFSFFIHHFKPKRWRRRRKNKLNMQMFKMFAANNIQWGWYGLFLKRNMGTFRITTTAWKLWQFSDRNRKWNSQKKKQNMTRNQAMTS